MTSCVLAFKGERLDPVSETYHLGNGYRAYSPVLMRFTSPDSWSPFGPGGINSYAYCAGDPVNRSDPSGHMSWQAGLGIGLGILGMLGAVFTGGASIAAAGSISAALAGASTVSLVVGAAALVADVTGIASAATEESNPEASAALGWTSLVFGILSLGAGIAGRMARQGPKSLEDVIELSGYSNLNILNKESQYFLFDDVYKGKRRLNIVGHGYYSSNRGYTVAKLDGVNLTGSRFADYLSDIGIEFDKYDYARTALCYSGRGEENSFMATFSERSGLATKGYLNTVEFKGLLVSAINRSVQKTRGSLEAAQGLVDERYAKYLSDASPGKSWFSITKGPSTVNPKYSYKAAYWPLTQKLPFHFSDLENL